MLQLICFMYLKFMILTFAYGKEIDNLAHNLNNILRDVPDRFKPNKLSISENKSHYMTLHPLLFVMDRALLTEFNDQ